MASILASVSVELGADIKDFKAAMAQARRELRGLVQAAEAMQDVGKTLTQFVSVPLAALGALSIKIGGDFESAFNRVEAATQASGAELDALRAKTKNIALDPTLKFSATQAAAALENLAKNGLSSAQILNGAADATVNLATATGGQLATSADIATDVMNNFNLTAAQLAASVNTITGTTIASKLDIDNYRQALGQAGGVAGQLGVSFTDFNTALAVTSSGFSSGSDAGTSFKTFLQRLVPQSKEAKEAMDQLGLKFFDAQGQMKPLRAIAGELQTAFKGLSDQSRSEFGTKIFGADSIRTALLLAKDGAEGFDKMAESIGKVNAATQGQTLSKGFNGALEGLKSAFEGLQIAIAESGLLEFATRATRALAGFASDLARLDPAILRTITVLAGIAIAVGPVLFAIGSLGLALVPLKVGFATLGIVAKASWVAITGPIGLVVLGIAAVAAAALILRNEFGSFRQAGAAVGGMLAQLVIGPLTSFRNALTTLGFPLLSAAVDFLIGKLGMLRDKLFGIAQNKVSFGEFFKDLLSVGDASLTGAVSGNELSGSLSRVGGEMKKTTLLTKAQTDALEKQALAAQKLNEGYTQLASRSVKGMEPKDAPDFKLDVPKGLKNEGFFAVLPPVDNSLLIGSLQVASAQLAQFQLTAEIFTAGLDQVLVGGFQNMAVGIGEAIGQMALSVGGVELIAGALLAGIGGMAVQLGQLAIGAGIATLGIKAALESLNPALAIAGGVALVALGTAVRGAAGRISAGGGGGGAAGLATGSSSASLTAAASTPRASEQRIQIELMPVVFRQAGPDLDAVVSVNKYRQLRQS